MSIKMGNLEGVTVNELIARGRSQLIASHRPDAIIDARLLALYVLNYNTAELLLHGNNQVESHLEEYYMELIKKRSQGVPLQHITNSQEFMGLEFYVDEHVLIPRQDTETLIETVIEYSNKHKLKKAVEIGVGSGCISVSLAHYIEDIHITGIDICEDALKVADKNISAHRLTESITLLKSDIFTDYDGEEDSLDLIISNPPYITLEECKELMEEVIEYEPRKALTDEGDGLRFYRVITKEGKKYLKQGGLLAYEIGYLQGKDVCAILEQEGFKDIQLIQDLAHRDRVVIGTKI